MPHGIGHFLEDLSAQDPLHVGTHYCVGSQDTASTWQQGHYMSAMQPIAKLL